MKSIGIEMSFNKDYSLKTGINDNLNNGAISDEFRDDWMSSTDIILPHAINA